MTSFNLLKKQIDLHGKIFSWFIVQTTSSILIFLIPVLIKYKSISILNQDEIKLLSISAGLYIATILFITFYAFFKHRIKLSEVLITYAILVFLLLNIIIWHDLSYSRLVLAIYLGLAIIFLILPLYLYHPIYPTSLLVICLIIVFHFYRIDYSNGYVVTNKIYNTAFYNIKATYYNKSFSSDVDGGGLDMQGDHVFMVTGAGDIFLIDPTAESISIEQLPIKVPVNREDFIRDSGGKVRTDRFRVFDILVDERDSRTSRIYVSHHYWLTNNACYESKISYIDFNPIKKSFISGWHTLYRTTPCITLLNNNKIYRFLGEESGGRMIKIDDDHLLFSTGDYGYEGLKGREAIPQNERSDYGKIIRINVDTGSGEIFSLGHRNPQGLYKGEDGVIFSTEHGPRGGDELNIIKKGANYGWPLVTYGTAYGKLVWPPNHSNQGTHKGYEKPVYAWVPSIGVSNLIKVKGKSFAIWKNNLLVSSLTGQTLFRIKLDNTHKVKLSEPIIMGDRIRDLIELQDGRILMMLDSRHALVVLSPLNIEQNIGKMTGEFLFINYCQGCHEINDGKTHKIGPDLYDIQNRKIGSNTSYKFYSPAMKSTQWKWTPELMDKFLQNPQRTVPGISMNMDGLENPEDRKMLVEFLFN